MYCAIAVLYMILTMEFSVLCDSCIIHDSNYGVQCIV